MADSMAILGLFEILRGNFHSHFNTDIQALLKTLLSLHIASPIQPLSVLLSPENLLKLRDHKLAIHDPLGRIDEISNGSLLRPEDAGRETDSNILAIHLIMVLMFQDFLFEECEDEHEGPLVQLG